MTFALVKKLFRSSGAVDPRICRLLSEQFCRSHQVVLVDVRRVSGNLALLAYVVDPAGKNELSKWYYKNPENLKAVQLAANLGSSEVPRLLCKTKDDASEIVDLINQYLVAHEIQRIVQPQIAKILTLNECREGGILFAYIQGLTLHCWCLGNPKAKAESVSKLLMNEGLQKQIATFTGIPIAQAARITPQMHLVDKAVFDRELKRCFDQPLDHIDHKQDRQIQKLFEKYQPTESASEVRQPITMEPGAAAQLLNRYLLKAFECGASDIHLYLDPKNWEIKQDLIIDGMRMPGPSFALTNSAHWDTFVLNILNRAGRQPDERFAGPIHDRVDFNFGQSAKFTTRLAMQQEGEAYLNNQLLYTPLIVFRLQREEDQAPILEDLGHGPYETQFFDKITEYRTGFVCIGGPVGHGKTRTCGALFCTIHYRYPERVLGTIERPIERDLPVGIHQFPVKSPQGAVETLEACLRQNFNGIYVGEANEPLMLNTAIDGANTSSFVLVTVHYDNVFQAPARLKSLGCPPAKYALPLKMLLTQRLIRVNCPTCTVKRNFADDLKSDPQFKKRWSLLPDLLDHWGIDHNNLEHAVGTGVVDGKPCPDCRKNGVNLGTVGRLPIFEFLPTEFIAEELLDDAPEFELRRATFQAYPHETLYHAGIRLWLQKRVSLGSLFEHLGPINPYVELLPGYEKQQRRRTTYYNPYDYSPPENNGNLHQQILVLTKQVELLTSLVNAGKGSDARPDTAVDADVIDEV